MELKFTVVLLFLIIIAVICAYNKVINLRNFVKEAFSTMDVYLKKRWDLVPNLVECVKAYTEHENNLFVEVTKLRVDNYNNLSQDEKFNLNVKLNAALPTITAIAENYPNLKANENYAKLIEQLTQIEEDIANSRKYYNGTVRELNTFLEVFPTNLIGILFGISKEKMFEIESEQRENIKAGF